MELLCLLGFGCSTAARCNGHVELFGDLDVREQRVWYGQMVEFGDLCLKLVFKSKFKVDVLLLSIYVVLGSILGK